uniref:DNA-directed DNA polymerase n=1 Tax=Globodera pallida TaxID=36090 RepID=A0A183BP01_GLOPA
MRTKRYACVCTRLQIGRGRKRQNREGRSNTSTSSTEVSSSSVVNNNNDDNDEAFGDNADDYFSVVGVWESAGSRSRHTRMETIEVRFQNWERAKRPDQLLAACIERLLQRVLAGRVAPLRVGLSLQPPGWDNCFHIPMRSPEQNSACALAAAIEAFAKQYDALDLFSADVRFKVSAVWPLIGTENVSGACAADDQQARGTVHCQSFVPIVNIEGGGAIADRWCLARAIVIGLADRRLLVLEQRTIAQFRAFCESQRGAAGAPAARLVLQEAGVRVDLPGYGVPEAKRIQRWLDAMLGPHQVRLVIFTRESGFRVVWKGSQRPARFNLCLVAQSDHYGYIQRPEQLFHARQFCVDCEHMVDRRTHPQGCRALCAQCFRFGWERPCQREVGEATLRCDDCLFVFANADCFAAHRRRVDPTPPGWQDDRRRGRPHRSMCEERRVCVRCRQIVWARHGAHQCAPAANDNNDNNDHQQQRQQLFCNRCQAAHDAQWTPHFIQPRSSVRQFAMGGAAAADDAEDAPQQPPVMHGSDGSDADANNDNADDDAAEEAPQQQRRRRRRQPPIRFLFWDVESAQERVDAAPPGGGNVEREEEEEEALRVLKHVPVLVCAEVICERCIALGVDVEREPLRRAPNCCCGAAWRGEPRRRWAMRLREDAFSDDDDDDVDNVGAADEARVAQQEPVDRVNPRRLRFFNTDNNDNGGGGRTAMEQFVDFLLHTGPINVRTVMLAHNGVSGFCLIVVVIAARIEWLNDFFRFQGRYDVHLLIEELQRQGIRPRRLVASGLRVYTLQLGGRNQRQIIAKDTLNFFGCALAKLPAVFGLQGVADKPFFPYNYIHEANMDVALVDELPPRDDYDPERMRPAERAQFVRWYEAEQQRRHGRQFVLRRELLRYCANDVRILRCAALRFRQVVGALANGMEPFMAATTIAGLALAIYRQRFLPPNVMVHTPEGGFLRGRRASAASRHFFALLEEQRPEWRGRLRTAQWSIGEEGCPKCYPQRQQRLAGGQPAELLYVRTQQRAWELEHQHGYELKVVWECDFRQLLRRQPEMRRAYTDVCRAVPGPLDLRHDALFGGRTEPFALHFDCAEEEEVEYLDIVSLYPFVMKYRAFPVGLPQVLTGDQLQEQARATMPWQCPADNPFRGFLFCRVLPPSPSVLGDRHALLPYRTRGGRLTFPLCAKCAELGNVDNNNNNNNNQRRRQHHRALPRCRHPEEQRAWTHAYTHVELNAALALGYRVQALYEVWDYGAWASLESGNSLFADYVDTLLRLKVEASGWPADCVTPEQRAQFINDYAHREGIHIDAQQVQHNAGLRAVVKALLNALWGKLAQRAERDDIHYTGSAREFHDLLLDPKQDVVDFVHLNEHLDRCVVRRRHPFVQGPATNNLAVACFVTSHARLYLHERLEEVRAASGRSLYCDTDSVLFVKRRGAARLASEGDALGQLKREFPGRRIVQFFSAGPKNYGFRHVCALTGGDEQAERKIRGLQLTYAASQLLPFDRMCRLVLNFFGRRPRGHDNNAEHRVAVPVRRFVRTKKAQIFTRPSVKMYRPVFTKGLVVAVPQAHAGDAYFTRPFGWYAAGGTANSTRRQRCRCIYR